MSLQVATDPGAVDLDATFTVLAEMVPDWMRVEGDRQPGQTRAASRRPV
jgi:hypothetical protein